MSNSEEPVADVHDDDIQTDVPRMCDASTQTDARETNPVYETTASPLYIQTGNTLLT